MIYFRERPKHLRNNKLKICLQAVAMKQVEPFGLNAIVSRVIQCYILSAVLETFLQ